MLTAALSLSLALVAPQAVAPTFASSTVATASGDVRVYAIDIGSIAVKRAHAELVVPRGTPTLLRFLHIFGAGGEFQPPMPILAYVIDHPEGVFIVDTGEVNDGIVGYGDDERAADQNLLRISIDKKRELRAQLDALAIDVNRLRGIVLTHLHVDHVGGVAALPRAPVYTARIDVELGPQIGGRPSRIPADAPRVYVEDVFVDHGDDVDDVFGRSHALTRDGLLRILPASGHTPGALQVLLKGTDRDVLFAGDSGFTDIDICTGRALGIHVDLDAADDTMARDRLWLSQRPTIVLPAHDPNALARLSTQTPTSATSATSSATSSATPSASTSKASTQLALGDSSHFHWRMQTDAPVKAIWRRFTDPSTWASWDSELASAALGGGSTALAAGATGTLTLKDGTTAAFRVDVVDEEQGIVTFTTALPAGGLTVQRRVWHSDGKTWFEHDVRFTGLSGALFAAVLGGRYRAALPPVMRALEAQATADR